MELIPPIEKLSNDYEKLPRKFNRLAESKWCHIASSESTPKLYKFIEIACEKLNIKKPPQVLIYDSNEPPYGCTGFHPSSKTVFLDLCTARFLNEDGMLEAVIGHELGHQKMLRRNFLTKVAKMTATAAVYKGAKEQTKSNIESYLTAYLVYAALNTTQVHFEELAADGHGATASSPENMANVIKTIRDYSIDRPDIIDKVIDTLTLAGSYPSDNTRIKALEKRQKNESNQRQ